MRTTPKERRIAAVCNGTHPICVSSDSGLPECACWCAECKDVRAARQWIADQRKREQLAWVAEARAQGVTA